MRNAINWILVSLVTGTLRVFRLPWLSSTEVYSWLAAPRVQPLLEAIGRRKAYDVYRRAAARCPAYRRFLVDQHAPRPCSWREFAQVPETTKANYVKAYSIEDRCHNGRFPRRGVVIDESSGSSGEPNNWVRGRSERASVRRLLRHGSTVAFGGKDLFVLNCFALGPWATGMNVTMSLVDTCIMKSIGPDRQKLENTLRTFGTRYRYLITGYPPFVKDFLDATDLDLAGYELHLAVGGEGITEGLRDRLARVFRSVYSSYGASDLEINIAAETEFTIALRKRCVADPALCRDLFGREDAPMLFQYNPLDYMVERSAEGELVVTILRRATVAPKIRYNIRDVGGSVRCRDLEARLRSRSIDPSALTPRRPAFPILFVYGRSDLTVPFYGAKVFVSDLESILSADPMLQAAIHSFQLRSGHDADFNETLTIVLERSRGTPDPIDPADLHGRLFDGLMRHNQDFREVSRMFSRDRVMVEQHALGGGPFAQRDIRLKNQYVVPASPRLRSS